MEIKVIAYILFGLAYWYLKNRKEKSQDVPVPQPPPSQNQPNPQRGKSIEEILREIEMEARRAFSEKQSSESSTPAKMPASGPAKSPENTLRPDQEGSLAYVPSILQTATSEGISSLPEGISSISDIMKQEDEGLEPMKIDLRQAFIHQLILERKTR